MKSVFVFILVLFCTLAQSHAQFACREIALPEGESSRTAYCGGSKKFNEELFYSGEGAESDCCESTDECGATAGLAENGMFYFDYCIPDGMSSDCDCRSILAAAIPDLKSALESDINFDGSCET